MAARTLRIPVAAQVMSLRSPTSSFDHHRALRRCAQGDLGGLRALHDHEAERFRGMVLRIVGSEELAEAALARALARIWARAASLDLEQAAASDWIFGEVRAAAREVLDHKRPGRRRWLPRGRDDASEHWHERVWQAATADLEPPPRRQPSDASATAAPRHLFSLARLSGAEPMQPAKRIGLPADEPSPSAAEPAAPPMPPPAPVPAALRNPFRASMAPPPSAPARPAQPPSPPPEQTPPPPEPTPPPPQAAPAPPRNGPSTPTTAEPGPAPAPAPEPPSSEEPAPAAAPIEHEDMPGITRAAVPARELVPEYLRHPLPPGAEAAPPPRPRGRRRLW